MNSRILPALALLAIAGCTPPRPEQLTRLKAELARHFSNLNRDAEMRKIDLKTPRSGVDDHSGLGRQFSDHTWHPDLVIVVDVACLRCKTAHTVAPYHPETNARVLCPKCGAGDDKAKEKSPPLLEGKLSLEQLARRAGEANVRPMFEAPEGGAPKDVVKVKVRYLRRQWVYDPTGRVAAATRNPETADLLSSAPYEPGALTDIDGRPTAPSLRQGAEIHATQTNYYYGGYHRVDSSFIGEMEVEYRGGLSILSGPVEEPIRPWTRSRPR